MNENLGERWTSLQQRVATAAKKSGRAGNAVLIVAVTKTHPAETVREAFVTGMTHFGENKVQEARKKIPDVGRGIWHLIGHLQSNKAREAVELFDRIDSIDSIDIAREINTRAAAVGKRMAVLLQVNVAGESTKFGVPPREAAEAAAAINEMDHLELQGLMTLAPFAEEPERVRPIFARLRELRDTLEKETGLKLPELSMGMSHDFEIAVEEGSTQVRLGSSLFGARPKKQRPEDGDA